ncbi:single-stranded-DNA-specific exonuclease RecJ [Paenibacillus agricola]|uniref:Single-stranded-DNA-specific exonuclease RecJ n=1 Tax=Paenibacillus agricola TaxID=2716264 RepID=A0ABX0J5E8_9BACL|nr:single-stranded-DNA-specific exonuclease RecJ [Paenibacillus agricola]NHN30057.1 single-stranded-DNA-specific exonuclease RecJ [Paenibacillus agricola]
MLHSRARWNISEADEVQVNKLIQELSVDPLLARLLIARGMTDITEVNAFLQETTDSNHDPFLLDGMGEAVARIRLALEQRQKIRIYGDYDADGVSSTTLMVHLLTQLNASFDYYIPHRVHEGYGLNLKAMDLAHEQGIQLIITVDTGISAVEEIAHAVKLGLDVIVTDHHEPPERLPEACIIINPKQPGCGYPFKQLAGVGVAFKLAQAMLGRWPEELLEFAAIGTVADLMPLLDENRMIVKQGIKRMRSSANPGIKALFQVAGINMLDVNATHIGFALAPRINASGRLESADAAVQLLTTDDDQEASRLALEMDLLNKERQRIVDEMTKQALALVDQSKPEPMKRILVLAEEDWNVGVVGIVASKLVDRFYRPTLVLSIDKETGLAKGSARSIVGFDLFQALTHCQDLLDHYGGHQAAAGMTLAREHLPELERRLNLLAEEWLSLEDFTPIMQVDLVCTLEEIAVTTVQQLELLGPFGMGNPMPKVVIADSICKELRTIGKEQQHIKITLRTSKEESAATLDAVGFNKSAMMPWISSTASLDVLGELSINEWNGVRKPQVMIQDMRIIHTQLFDWRGAAKIELKLSELSERLSAPSSGAEARAAIFIFETPDAKMLKKYEKQFPIWTMNQGKGNIFSPANILARTQSPDLITDVILYDLPPDIFLLGEAIRGAKALQRIYAIFQSNKSSEGALPTRDMFKTVYGAVHKQAPAGMPTASFTEELSKRSGLSPNLIQFMLQVFNELGLVARTEIGYKLVNNPDKKDLTLSQLYQSRLKSVEAEQTLLYSSAHELLQWLLSNKQSNLLLEEQNGF